MKPMCKAFFFFVMLFSLPFLPGLTCKSEPEQLKQKKREFFAFRVNDVSMSPSPAFPAIAIDGSGNFVITWQDWRNTGPSIFAQRFNSAGTPRGYNFKVNDDNVGVATEEPHAIAMDSTGNFVIAWANRSNDDGDIYAQRYNSLGTPQGSNFKVDDDVGIAYLARPAIAMDGLGSFVITWEDYRLADFCNCYAQRYNAAGMPQGSNFKVNYAVGCSGSPSIAMNGSGNFVIEWERWRNNDVLDIHAQSYDSAGTPKGSNFKVNDVEITYSASPSIAMDSAGNFVIAWTNRINDDGDIYAQRYSSLGAPQGSNFKVDDDIGIAFYYPAIAMDGSGNFVVAWFDGRDGNYDIYAQRYESSGNRFGVNYLVTNPKLIAEPRRQFAVGLHGSNVYFTWKGKNNINWDIYAKVVDWTWP